MAFNITLWSLILMFGVIQGFILSVIFLRKKNRTKRNSLFALLVLIITFIQLDHSLRLSDLYKIAPSLIYTSDAIWYLIAPLLLFYTKLYINNNYVFKWYDLFHFLPFLIMSIWYYPLLTANPDVKISIIESFKTAGSYGLVTNLLILFMMLQMLSYIFYSSYLLMNYEKNYKTQFSENHIMHLAWLKYTFLFFLVYFLFEFTFSSLRNFWGFRSAFLDNWSLVVWVVYIYTIAYQILSQPSHVFPAPFSEKAAGNNQNYWASNADIEKLREYMKLYKPFLRCDLKLSDLASELEFSPNYLSFLLNNILKVNFYEYINSYRALEAEQMLMDSKYSNLTISGIANEAGFKSKTSFYKFFKKEFNTTPKKYLASKK